ncbi:MAG: hypothetical protein GX660_19690 [Clostridiaceae bacterium]|nr:hypothetical protein [Clostridiaceae bacterium]
MKKVYLLLSALLLFNFPSFSFSPRIESLNVKNYSNSNILVEQEFNAGVAVQEKNYFLNQTVGDITIKIKDSLRVTNVIQPYKLACLHECFAISSTQGNDNLYERMLALPLMEKIKAIYKTLTIYDTNGNVLVSLDTLSERMIKREVLRGETAYYIEIFDKDLEARPASEW